MKLSHKLLAILVGFTCVSLLLSLALARWSFQQGFTEFIHNQERERLSRLSQIVISQYVANNNQWDNIQLSNHERSFAPPPQRRLPPRTKNMPPHRPQFNDISAGPPTQLLDASGALISGDSITLGQQDTVHVDLKIGDSLIGSLVSYPPKIPESEIAQAFSVQQLHGIIFIGIVSLVASLILALVVIPRMINPFKVILNGVKGLTAHQYKLNLPENRQDEFGELMHHINTLGKTLEDHKNTKSQWLADVSHELRTPLTILSGEIELIKAGIRPLDQKQLESFDQEVARLSHLVEDLYQLSLSDIGGLSYHFSHINLAEIVTTQANNLAHIFEEKGLNFTYTCPSEIVINADPQRLQQLTLNLLVNACEYTDAPGTVTLTVTLQTNWVVITIEDSAPGINAGNESLLFEPLFREDSSRKRRAQGGGLGLSISKNIVEAHRGKITASASSLGGAKLSVTLPFNEETGKKNEC